MKVYILIILSNINFNIKPIINLASFTLQMTHQLWYCPMMIDWMILSMKVYLHPWLVLLIHPLIQVCSDCINIKCLAQHLTHCPPGFSFVFCTLMLLNLNSCLTLKCIHVHKKLNIEDYVMFVNIQCKSTTKHGIMLYIY